MQNKKDHPTRIELIVTRLTVIAASVNVFLLLFSWIVTTADTGINVRSMLSTEGIRWFFGTFVQGLTSPVLIWAILLSIGFGISRATGLTAVILDLLKGIRLSYRNRIALITSIIAMVAMLSVCSIMAFSPHAILLGITGELLPSPFSASIIPAIAFIITVISAIYGLQCGQIVSLNDLFQAMAVGPKELSKFALPYIIVMTLLRCVQFIFGI